MTTLRRYNRRQQRRERFRNPATLARIIAASLFAALRRFALYGALTLILAPRVASAQDISGARAAMPPDANDDALLHLLKKSSEAQFIHEKRQAEFAEQARNLALERRDTFGIVQSYCLLGTAYQGFGAQDSEIFFHRQALDYATLSRNARSLAHALNGASEMHRLRLMYDSAHFYADRAIRYALEAKDSVIYARALGNKGQVLVRERKFDEAITLFRRAQPIFQRYDETGHVVRTLLSIGYATGLQGDHEQETQFYEQAFKISKSKGYTLTMAEAACSIGESMFHLKRFDVALPHLRYALRLGDSLESQIIRKEANLFLSQLYEAQGNWAEAFRYYKQFIRVVEFGRNGGRSEFQIAEIQRYEQLIRDQQELLMQREAAEAQMRQTVAGVGSALLLLVAAAGLLYWRSSVNKRAQRRDEELQLFASYTSDVITRHDAQGLYRYVSPGISNLLGYAPEDLLGKNPYPFIHPDDVPAVKTAYKRTLKTKEAGMQSLRFRKKNGEYLWIEVSFKPILGANGEIKEFIHTTRDISDRVKAEERLRASEATLRATLYNTPNVAVQWYDETGRVILWNNASETMFGWSEKEALGKTLDQLFYTPEEFQTFLRIVQQILESGVTFGPFEYEFRRRDGRTAHSQSTMFAVPAPADGDKESSKKIVVCMDLDITEQKNAEIALQQSFNELDEMLRMMSVGVAVNIENRYVFTNAALQNILGYTDEELRALENVETLIHEEDLPLARKRYKERLQDARLHTSPLEMRYLHKNGKYVWVQVSGLIITRQNRRATLVTFVDITARKQTQELLSKRERQLSAIMNNTSDVIFSVDPEYRFITYNARLEENLRQFFGVTMYPGMDALAVAPRGSELYERWLSWYARALQGETFTIEHFFTEPKPQHIEVSFNPIRAIDGSVEGVAVFQRDISLRKQAEIALRNSEERLRSIMEAMSEGLLMQDKNFKILYINSALSVLLGVSSEEIYATTIFDARLQAIHENGEPFHNEERPSALALKTGKPQYDVTMGVVKPDGSTLWLLVNAHPITNPGETEPYSVVSTFTDITRRKEIELALRDSEARLRSIVGAMSEGLVVQDANDVILFSNESAERILGLSNDQLYGRSSYDPTWRVVHEDGSPFTPDDRPSVRTMQTGEPTQDVVMGVHKPDGSLSWILTNAQPIFKTGETTPSNVVVTFADITERKNAEIALRQNEERLRSIVEAMSEGLVLHNRNGAVIFCNPAAARILGVSEAQLLRSTSLDFEAQTFHEDGSPFLAKEHPATITLSTGKPQSEVIMGLARSDAENDVVWMSINSRPIFHANDAPDAPSAVVVTIADVSERKEVELLIQEQLNALEAKNAEMERFIYTISHDLKSPLITIKGFLGMIEEDVAAGDYSRVANDLKRIDNATNKMQNLLEDLLELSRVGRVINPSERFSLTVLANETVELLHGILTQRNVTVVVQPDLPSIVADKARFREVFQNLIENASKFMGAQTEPRIEIGMITDDIEPIYFVRDNGVGIAKEYQETIFGLFDKLDQHSDGTGIGLALVKRIIELHGGRIWVESELGKGATFFFTCKTDGANAEGASIL